MTFASLATGEAVFVDANPLTYHFQPHPVWGRPCRQLLQRIQAQDLLGFTSTHVLSEVSHRLMTIEAAALFGWPIRGIGNRLRTNPGDVQQLTAFRQAIERIAQSKLQVLTVTSAMLVTAATLCQQLGLLTNDGLIVAVMRANALTNLASSDADFDRVPGLTRYAPV